MAKTLRVRSDKGLLPVADWFEADKLVREMGDCQLRIAAAEKRAKEAIDKIKAELAKQVAPEHEHIDLLTKSLEAFAVNRQGEFGGRRSRQLDFGLFGWRKSSSVSVQKTTLDLIKQVFSSQKAKQLIRIKESVDKDALARLTDEELAGIGARRVHRDVFFVEPDIPQAANHKS